MLILILLWNTLHYHFPYEYQVYWTPEKIIVSDIEKSYHKTLIHFLKIDKAINRLLLK